MRPKSLAAMMLRLITATIMVTSPAADCVNALKFMIPSSTCFFGVQNGDVQSKSQSDHREKVDKIAGINEAPADGLKMRHKAHAGDEIDRDGGQKVRHQVGKDAPADEDQHKANHD